MLGGMNPPRATPADYIQFLLGTPSAVSATEAARVQPARPNAPAHDAFTRLLHRLEPDPDTLWAEDRRHRLLLVVRGRRWGRGRQQQNGDRNGRSHDGSEHRHSSVTSGVTAPYSVGGGRVSGSG